MATVIAAVEPIPADAIRYDYGDGGHWTHWIRCGPLHRAARPGAVSYQQMLSILGRRPRTPGYVFGLYEVKNPVAVKTLTENILP
jgi:hypothetical protein